MTICRVEHDKDNPYVMLNKTIAEDETISWKAKGLWLYAMSKRDDWQFYMADLLKKSPDGRGSVRAGLKELEKAGYLQRSRVRNSDGRMGEAEWLFFEKKREPRCDNPTSENPTLDNNPLVSNEYIINKEEREPSNSVAPSQHALRLAHLLFDLIKSGAPNAKEPNWPVWGIELERMQRSGYTWEEIESLITFVQQDPFWKVNCLSPTALRKHATRLTLLKPKTSAEGMEEAFPWKGSSNATSNKEHREKIEKYYAERTADDETT